MTEYLNTEAVARLFEITPRRVRGLAAEGILPKAGRGKYELVPVVQAYTRYLKNNVTQNGTDLASARTRTELARAEKLETELAVYKREYAPISIIEEILSKTSSAAAKRLDAIPSRLKQKAPELKSRHIMAIKAELAAARNQIAGLQLRVGKGGEINVSTKQR